MCSVPVVIGHYWIQTVAGLDCFGRDGPEKSVEVSRLTLDPHFPMPHWLAAYRNGNHLVVTGNGESWVLVVQFDPDKGVLSLDPTFREPGATLPGISFDRREMTSGEGWPRACPRRAVRATLIGKPEVIHKRASRK